jgi:hypothetical protein
MLLPAAQVLSINQSFANVVCRLLNAVYRLLNAAKVETTLKPRAVINMVMPTLPVEGASLLHCSDLAGEMAIINVIVYDEQSYEDNELENTEVLYACVLSMIECIGI